MAFIAPAFAQYPLGTQYTAWLYGDRQSNPEFWDKPETWESQSSMVSVQDRSINVGQALNQPGNLLPASPYFGEFDFDLAGGRNCIVFNRFASVFNPRGLDDAQQLPVQVGEYVLVGQRTVEGVREIDVTSLFNVFGFGWARHQFPVPMMWNDKLRRLLYVENGWTAGGDLSLVVGWKVAWLNTGA